MADDQDFLGFVIDQLDDNCEVSSSQKNYRL